MGLRVKLDTTMNIIVSCCILHNIAVDQNYVIDEHELAIDMDQPELIQRAPPNIVNENTSMRASLLVTHFNH